VYGEVSKIIGAQESIYDTMVTAQVRFTVLTPRFNVQFVCVCVCVWAGGLILEESSENGR
jgi:hypothetical protein